MLLNQVTDKTVQEIPFKYISKENNLFTTSKSHENKTL